MKKLTQAFSKMFAVFGVALLLASAAPSYVVAANNPRDPVSHLPMNPMFLGAKVCRADNTTSATSCATASGLLYALCAYGTVAVAGKGSMAFDTANASHTSGFEATGQAISPIVYATRVVSGNDTYAPLCWVPSVPARFENGLGIKQDDAGHDTIALYRLDSGVNP